MKVRRYFAPDMRTALAAARREQGADVMIIGQRKVDGGLELVTADEYDEEILASYTPPKPSFRAVVDDSDDADVPTPSARRPAPASRSDANAPEPSAIKPYVFPQVPNNNRKPAAAAAVAPKPAAVRNQAGTAARTSATATTGAAAVDTRRNGAVRSETLWTREPVMDQMQQELRSLRGLLQQQFATLAWSDMRQRNPLAAYLLRRAVGAGVAPRLASELAQSVSASLSFDQGWEKFLGLFSQRLRVTGNELMERGGAAVLVGPTGVGKTTLICKLAAQFALKHGARNVAVVTTDSQRIAAHEQLRSFGRIMGIPVRVAAGVEELLPALDAVYDRKLVLVDTAGMGPRDRRIEITLAALRDCAPLVRSFVVASAATPQRDLEAIFKRYAPVMPAGVMLTKLDDATLLGPALSAAILHQLPVAYVSGGQRIPEDVEVAAANTLVQRAIAAMSADSQVERGEVDLMMEELFRGGDKVHAHA
jgi:flagellar biosynthesis protein FlhF